MKFNGYHHIGLSTKDAEKSLDFYTKVLGGKEVMQFPMPSTGKTIYMVDLGGNAVVEIVPNGTDAEEANPRWAHIALRTDDAKAAYEEAIKGGAVSRSEPREMDVGTMKMCIAFVYGPDHEVVEFFQLIEEKK